MEKLTDLVTYIYLAILKAFGENVSIENREGSNKAQRLGEDGLALHYAKLINQINNIASRPMTVHPDERDTLYNSLPATVKAGLYSRLHALDSYEAMTMPEIKAEMEKTLDWLLPLATNTIKAYQRFGSIGEWANSGFVFGKTAAGNYIIRLQTLDHADRHKVDQYILLDLLVLLHRLVKLTKFGDEVSESNPAHRSLTSKASTPSGQLERVKKGKDILDDVPKQKTAVLGASTSHEFVTETQKKRAEVFASSGSVGS